jgi:predicted nucleic acid-binding protein
MKILFDTSVLISGMIEAHPFHARGFEWLRRAKEKEFEWAVCAHALAELYASLTAMPLRPMINPETAERLIHENIQGSARVIFLTGRDYRQVIKALSKSGLTGGVVYDALIVRAAEKFGADHLLTHNRKDFLRLFPNSKSFLIFP